MRRLFPVALPVACCALLLLVFVATAQQQQTVDPCEDAVTQQDMNVCYNKEFKAADAALNISYKQLVSKAGADDKVKLKTAATAWIKYRDANCEYESSIYEGGTMQPMIYSVCLARMTKARTVEIKAQIEDLQR